MDHPNPKIENPNAIENNERSWSPAMPSSWSGAKCRGHSIVSSSSKSSINVSYPRQSSTLFMNHRMQLGDEDEFADVDMPMRPSVSSHRDSDTNTRKETSVSRHDVSSSNNKDTKKDDSGNSAPMDPQKPVMTLHGYGQWLSSIPSIHADALQGTQEYRDLIHCLHKLERVHQWLVHQDNPPPSSFLQFGTADEVLHFVMNFLDAQSLARLAATCTRLRRVVVKHANNRALRIFQSPKQSSGGGQRQLHNPIQLVRVAEQIQGILPYHPTVRVPALLLPQAIQLLGAGDLDFNGVYFCTGVNGNGFVFTKHIATAPRLSQPTTRTGTPDFVSLGERQEEPPGYQLKCIISRRFSNETLLWYCCKEELVYDSPSPDGKAATSPVIRQRYVFWARLCLQGEVSDCDVHRFWYPSQTSVLLAQSGSGWQSLSPLHNLQPPTVELLE